MLADSVFSEMFSSMSIGSQKDRQQQTAAPQQQQQRQPAQVWTTTVSNDSGFGDDQPDFSSSSTSVGKAGQVRSSPAAGKQQSAQATDSNSDRRVGTMRLTVLGPTFVQCWPARLQGVSALLAALTQRATDCGLRTVQPLLFESVCHFELKSLRRRTQQPALLPPLLAASPCLRPTFSLGRGSFGQVFLCWVGQPDAQGAHLRALKTTGRLATWRQECRVHASLQQGHTEASYRGTFVLWLANELKVVHQGREIGCMLLELATGGSLQELVTNLGRCGRSLSEREACFYLAELGCALDYLHHRGFLHLDFKADNVLVSAEGHVRLGDLGHALRLDSPHTSLAAGLCTFHLPVEILRDAKMKLVTTSTDWFSYGCLAYWLLHCCYPIIPLSYMRTGAEFANYMAGAGYRRLCKAFGRPASSSYRMLVCSLLHPEPKQRLGAKEGFNEILESSCLLAECGLLPHHLQPREARQVIESSCLLPPFVPLPL